MDSRQPKLEVWLLVTQENCHEHSLRRISDISLKKLEPHTSAAQRILFNKWTVKQFLEYYENVLIKYHFSIDRIINIDRRRDHNINECEVIC